MDLITKLRSQHLANYGDGINGEFLGQVADELERLQAMVVYDCREPGVCPDITALEKRLFDALIDTRLDKARAALEQIALGQYSAQGCKDIASKALK